MKSTFNHSISKGMSCRSRTAWLSKALQAPLSPAPFQYSVDGNVDGQLVDAGYGLKKDYKKIDVKGKIALVAVDKTAFYELVLFASDAGAKGYSSLFP